MPPLDLLPAAIELEQTFRDAQRRSADAARRHQANAPQRPDFSAALAKYKPASPQEIARREQRIAEAERVERVVAARKDANVPPLYANAKLDDFTTVPEDVHDAYKHAVDQLRGALTASGPAIFALCGMIGAGKTHMATGLVNAFTSAGRSARYTKTAHYIRDLRATWGPDRGNAEAAFEDRHTRYALLVLDEWQNRQDSANENVLLFRLLDMRYEAGRVTVLISNHATPDEFSESIDARIADRMADFDHGGLIMCDWPSVRGRIARR